MQAGPGDEQADRERGAAERVGDLMPDARQRQVQDIERQPDGAGPDQGIAHHRHQDGADRLLFGGGVMRQHGNAEDVDQRDDRDHRHRSQRQPGVAVEIDGDRERHIGLPAGGALENRGEGRPVDRASRQQRPQGEAQQRHQQQREQQRAADARDRHGGEIGFDECLDQQHREQHVIGQPLQPVPLRLQPQQASLQYKSQHDQQEHRQQRRNDQRHPQRPLRLSLSVMSRSSAPCRM